MRDLDDALDEFLAAHAAAGIDMPGVVLHVIAPAHGVDHGAAAGQVERGGDDLEPRACFRTASVTKTFVATAVMRLVDAGRLSVTDPVASHLSADARAMLARLSPDPDAVTVEHLLRHTSGIYDFGTDDVYRGTIGREPTKVWSAADLIGVAIEHGTPWGAPGGDFHYSDTGYVLLALVLEHHTGMPFAPALRELVGFDALGLTATWLEGKEPTPAGAPCRAHQYLGDVDTFDLDPSFDGYGGGGLVSTARDLATFLRALVAGAVLRPPSLAAMLDARVPTDLGEVGQRAGYGVFASTVDGVDRVGHEGFWGVWMYHFPAHDVTIAGAHTGLPFDAAAKRRLLHAALA